MYLNNEDRAAHLAAIEDNGPIDGASVTYCPEDDKLRLYVGRVPRPVYDALRAFGWNATPKQDCDFAAVWTVTREDMALALLPDGLDIEDEDTPPEERAADRAERFGGYRDKRLGEAIGHADAFDEGPAAIGAQSRQRAERIAKRLDRTRGRAVTQWSKAAYWTQRTEGVIGHALYKSSAHVRRGRIAKLESELRKIEANIEEQKTRIEAWRKVAEWYAAGEVEKSQRWAVALANQGYGLTDYTHPRTGERGRLWLLVDAERTADPITPAEAAAIWLEGRPDPEAGGYARHRDHLRNRLAYERQMLDSQGGSATEVEIEPGGYISAGRSWYQGSAVKHDAEGRLRVEKVNKSPATGRVTSVGVLCVDRWGNGDNKQFVAVMSVERLGEDAYRAPTDEERAAFAAEKGRKPAAPPLVNPTDEDAQRLQALLNAAAKGEPAQVKRITKAEYSKWSGEDRPYNVYALLAGPRLTWPRWAPEGAQVLARVRARQYGFTGNSPASVIVLTDKPQKPLPAAVFELAAQPRTALEIA